MLESADNVKAMGHDLLSSASSLSSNFTKPGQVAIELLNGLSESIFGGVAQSMVDLGWSVFPQEAYDGRKPGRIDGRIIRWKEDHNLANERPSGRFLRDCILQCASHNVAGVLGPASGHTFAVDIDVLDKNKAERITRIAEEVLGKTPYMRVGQLPKIALIYRHAPDEGVSHFSRRLADENGGPTEHSVEILNGGRSLTLHGRHHKTGKYFSWIGYATPLIDGPELAPMVRAETVLDFLAQVDLEFGFVKVTASPAASISWAADGRENVRTATIETGAAGRIADGREKYLSDLVWACVRANSLEICQARERGDRRLHSILAAVAGAVFDEFVQRAEPTGRWEPKNLAVEVQGRVARAAQKVEAPRPKMGLDQRDRIPDEASDLPTIELIIGDIEGVANQAERALIAAKRNVYQRDGAIVCIGEQHLHTAGGTQISAQRIFRLAQYALLEHLASSATWMKWDGRKHSLAKTSPPMWVAQTLMERQGRIGLPVLAGVIGAPTLRRDGSVLDQPGFDEATGLYFDPQGEVFPSIPDNPTKEDALQAVGKLKALIKDFPFVSAADRSVSLSMMLTACVRRSLRTAPLHAFTAPAAGTGKSTLVDLSCILATGREAGVLAQGRSDEETEKRLASALLAGDQVITLDNCVLPLEGELLCQMLTQTTVKPRILGRSETPEISTSALLAATGNGLIVGGDMTRRTLYGCLDAGVERPEERQFDVDVIHEAKRCRPELVVAALTVLRAFKVVGSPRQKPSLGSFEDWSSGVRDALVWVGEADPCDTMSRMRALDPKLEALTAVLAAWMEALETRRVSTATLVELAMRQVQGDAGQVVFQHPKLRAALISVAGAGLTGAISSRVLGRWLGGNADRRVGGFRIVRLGLVAGSPTWRVEG